MITLDTITVGQFQEIYKISKSDIDSEEKLTEMVSVLSGKPVSEVEEMPLTEFNNLAKQIQEVLRQPLPTKKPQQKINGYGITYEPAKLNRGQYVTVSHFMSKDVVENCHLILASLTYNPKTGKHESDKHAEIAEKMQDAKLADVYPATVFFCQLFADSMMALEDYLTRQLVKPGMNPMKVNQQIQLLMKDLGGFITQSRLPTLKV